MRKIAKKAHYVVSSWLLLAALNSCVTDPTTAAVGMICVPHDEFSSSFSGFEAHETTIETAHVDCAPESVCLIRHFQGRVTCPYGQTQAALSLPASDPRRCIVPRSDGEPVSVIVKPQLLGSGPEQGAYCSALCADSNGERKDRRRYHDCPAGFHCEKIVESTLARDMHLDGSYCVRNSTPDLLPGAMEACQADTTGLLGNCGDAHPSF